MKQHSWRQGDTVVVLFESHKAKGKGIRFRNQHRCAVFDGGKLVGKSYDYTFPYIWDASDERVPQSIVEFLLENDYYEESEWELLD